MIGQQGMRAVEDWCLIGLFVAALCVPILTTRFHRDPAESADENRQLAPLPPLSLDRSVLAAFPRKFGLFFNENFGLRNTLIRWQAIAKVEWLGVSTSPKVIVGKKGWLFDAGTDESDAGYRSGRPFTQEQLARWTQVLTRRADWLAQRGIPYFLLVVPEKQSVYPELIPYGGKPRTSRLDQLVAALRGHPNIEVLDVRAALIEQKSQHPLYNSTDTHWNSYGGLAAYQAVVNALAKSFRGMQPVQLSDCLMFTKPFSAGDLARLLGLNGVLTEEGVGLTVRNAAAVFEGDTMSADEPLVSIRAGADLPKLVMFRDSFATVIIPLLAEHFSRAVYVWDRQHRFHHDSVEEEHPNLVIQEMVDRYLTDEPPQDPLEPINATATVQKPQVSAASTGVAPVLEGVHDITNCNGIIGWAWDRNHPDNPVKVDIFVGERLLATVTAGDFRQDLLDAGIGDGRHNFMYPVPPQLKDGKPHVIRMKFAGTNVELAHTSREIKCDAE